MLTLPRPLDPEKTVLITGGTGGLGALVARHLVETHGARHLLLASRSGAGASGVEGLVAELEALGASVGVEACDVSSREEIEKLLAQVPDERPLGAVVHAAGVLDDATVEQMGAERLAPVFAPKADAAWHLHELTRGAELSAFVLFSSAAGALGAPGQGNYAAANAYLDALAARRRAEGLPATSIAWGLWEGESGMTAHLAEGDLARMERSGIAALDRERGLELFEAALACPRAEVLALELKRSGLRALAAAGALPSLLGSLVKAPSRPRSSGSFARKLASLPEAERETFAAELVRAEAAAVLGHASPREVDRRRAFKEIGFDSLAAVELRNRLQVATGLRLAATSVFDHPNVVALASYLVSLVGPGPGVAPLAAGTATDEPIAIVGMSCRYPGASSPAELWRLVAAGGDAIGPFPDDRGWDLDRLYDPDPDAPGACYAREGGFLADAARLRRRVLRHLPARGAGDGPTAAPAAGNRLGGAGRRRHRPRLAAGHRDRSLRGDQSLAHGRRERHRRARGLSRHGSVDQRRLRPHRLHPRPRGPGDQRRHRLLLLAGGDAPSGRRRCGAGSAPWPWPAASP